MVEICQLAVDLIGKFIPRFHGAIAMPCITRWCWLNSCAVCLTQGSFGLCNGRERGQPDSRSFQICQNGLDSLDVDVGSTLPETNIAPENRPLEKEIPIGNHHF